MSMVCAINDKHRPMQISVCKHKNLHLIKVQ